MKRLLIFFFFSASVSAQAQSYEPGLNAPDKTEAAPTCVQCQTEAFQDNIRHALEPIDLFLKSDLTTTCGGASCDVVHWAQSLRNRYPAKKCKSFFIDNNGKLGKNAQILVHDLARDVVEKNKAGQTSAFLKEYPDLLQQCPGFHDMLPAERVEMWAWLFEIIAYNESSCNVKTRDNDAPDVPNGAAVGLYQLDSRRDLRRRHGRECNVDDVKIHTAEANTACAVDVMRMDLTRMNAVFGTRNPKTDISNPSGKPYWESLIVAPRRERCDASAKHNLLLRDLHDFPLCNYTGSELPDCS